MKKLFIAGGVVLLVAVGGTFLHFLSRTAPEEEYSTTPTQWSQAGDYKIEETAEGTKVTNEKAGFSFVVPGGWRTSAVEQDPRIIESAQGDCRFFTSTLYQTDEHENLKNSISRIVEKPEFGQGIESKQEIVTVMGTLALQTTIFASVEEDRITALLVEIPFDNDGVVNFEVSSPDNLQSQCIEQFKNIVDTVSAASSQ